MRNISSITYTTNCFRTVGQWQRPVPCGTSDLVEAGMVVKIVCKTGYRSATTIEQQATCNANGEWNRHINPCTQVCGMEGPEGSVFIVGGQVMSNTKVPWHVGIYREGHPDVGKNDIDYICGGTILNPRLVVSAIHCFWDTTSSKVHPASEYRVVAGKFYRQFSDSREKAQFQLLHVKDIHYPDGYDHYDGLFANDVAVLVLETFIEFKSHVAPACINYRYGFEERVIAPNKTGRVAGWGLIKPGGVLSDELKTIELPVVYREDCLSSLNQQTRRFLTHDKYCAGLLNMSVGVCQGDSGGGLVFPEKQGGIDVYFLRGIVSSGPNHQSSCNINQYAFFTNTAHFTDLIENFDLKTKPEYVDVDASPRSCVVDVIPVRGIAFEDGSGGRFLAVGDRVVNHGVIGYRCPDGTTLNGNNENTCQNGYWKNRVPSCTVEGEFQYFIDMQMQIAN